jgi:hypothetical protein
MSPPSKCPECARIFKWGRDEDSAIVDKQGERWESCRENAHWKLTFHMQEAHPGAGFVCPRRSEDEAIVRVSPEGLNWWDERDGHKACSYCGSLSPAEFFAAVEAGAEVSPTDKNYKAYVALPNPLAGQTVEYGGESGPAFDRDGKATRPDLTIEEKAIGRFSRPLMGVAGPTVTAKFYFQHLSEDEKKRFIELLNAKKMKLAFPGHFYRLPFFCARVDAPKPAAAAGK